MGTLGALEWYRRLDSNQHGLLHRPLKAACLPISPLRQGLLDTVSGFLPSSSNAIEKRGFQWLTKATHPGWTHQIRSTMYTFSEPINPARDGGRILQDS
jgi:hypothetical protein